MSNLEKYNNIFSNIFDAKTENLNADFNFGAVPGWDSLAHLELIAQLEDEFEIMFETEDITHFGGYENGKKILEKYGVTF